MNPATRIYFSKLCTIFIHMLIISTVCSESRAQEVPYGIGHWNADSLGNHRVVVRVQTKSEAVWVHIPWRRRDFEPEKKNLIIIDGKTQKQILNIARVNINREFGDLVFQPRSGPGNYFIYYLPYTGSGRSNYPKIVYPNPVQSAQKEWLQKYHLTPEELNSGTWYKLLRAEVMEIQSIDALNSFYPMEVIATREEERTLLKQHPEASYLLFPEDRKNPIKMFDDLPHKWIKSGPGQPIQGNAMQGEFYAFQIGVYAVKESIKDIHLEFTDLKLIGGSVFIPASELRCFNTGGIDWTGKEFRKQVTVKQGKIQPLWFGVQIPEEIIPGTYNGTVTVAPVGMEKNTVPLQIQVSPERIVDSGDNEPWRHSRLRWLDSKIALDDDIVAPFTPVQVIGNRISILGRKVRIEKSGFPSSIQSYFAPEMTYLHDQPREILAGPVELIVENAIGKKLTWHASGFQFVKKSTGVVTWETKNTSPPLKMDILARMEFDGTIEFQVSLSVTKNMAVKDIRLEIPVKRDVARYMMGVGLKGGFRPAAFEWKWDVKHNQDGAWIGDVNAGLQFGLKDERYSRPLNTNFYHSKPLVMPLSWDNSGKGGCRFTEEGTSVFLVRCFSGERTIQADEVLHYNFRLAITPFKMIDPKAQWRTRFYHRFRPLAEIKATGANTVNVHHATRINPFINYPFLRPEEMKAYVDSAHAMGMKVKIYYTVRELSNRAPEIFALRSLGDEILSYGPGGGFSWLQEHLGSDYIAGWFVPRLKDAAVINSGVSRWHNYYLEGLDWLVQNIGIDGLYIDDVAFDRTVMQRVRKILDRGRKGALIDLHSANQFNVRDGFANSANLYLEHFPYINRLWFGEYFDYDSAPDFWLIELSGIPFGLMGEMLQNGGNPWRGMIYGMTSRLPWAGDPRPIWKIWDDFGIQESRMVGYWVASSPVKTNHPQVLATAYIKNDKTMVAIASWAREAVGINLEVDWQKLGLDSAKAEIYAPKIKDFQSEARFKPSELITVEPGRGFLLIIKE